MALRLVIGACSNEYVASWALQRMDDDMVRQTRREAAYRGKPRDASSPKSFAISSGPRTLRPVRTRRGPYVTLAAIGASRMYTISDWMRRRGRLPRERRSLDEPRADTAPSLT